MTSLNEIYRRNLKKLEEACEIDDACLVIGEFVIDYAASSGNNNLIQIYHSGLRSITILKMMSHAKYVY